MSYKTKFALFITVFLWASGFVGIRVGLQGYSPEGLALFRYLVASFCMAIIYFNLPNRRSIRLLDAVGLMGVGVMGIGIYNITLNYGELVISSGVASFIISQSPLIGAVIAILFLGERLSLKRILGFIISILGVALITLGEKGTFKWDTSLFYIFVATLVGALYSLFQKPFLKKYHAIEATAFIIWGATLFLAFYFPKLHQDLSHASLKTTLMTIYLGVFPAAIAYLAWGYALTEISAARAMSFLYFVPFVATLLGWFFLGEVPVILSILGGVFAIIGVWLVNQSYATSTASSKVAN